MTSVKDVAQPLLLSDHPDSSGVKTLKETVTPKKHVLEEKFDNSSNTLSTAANAGSFSNQGTRTLSVKRKITFGPIKDDATTPLRVVNVQPPKEDTKCPGTNITTQDTQEVTNTPKAPELVCAARQKLSEKLSQLINKVETRTGKKAEDVTDDEEGEEDDIGKSSLDEGSTAESSDDDSDDDTSSCCSENNPEPDRPRRISILRRDAFSSSVLPVKTEPESSRDSIEIKNESETKEIKEETTGVTDITKSFSEVPSLDENRSENNCGSQAEAKCFNAATVAQSHKMGLKINSPVTSQSFTSDEIKLNTKSDGASAVVDKSANHADKCKFKKWTTSDMSVSIEIKNEPLQEEIDTFDNSKDESEESDNLAGKCNLNVGMQESDMPVAIKIEKESLQEEMDTLDNSKDESEKSDNLADKCNLKVRTIESDLPVTIKIEKESLQEEMDILDNNKDESEEPKDVNECLVEGGSSGVNKGRILHDKSLDKNVTVLQHDSVKKVVKVIAETSVKAAPDSDSRKRQRKPSIKEMHSLMDDAKAAAEQHKILQQFEKPGPPAKKRRSAFVADELDSYLAINEPNLKTTTTNNKEDVKDENKSQDTDKPKTFEVDGFTLHLFTSKSKLSEHALNVRRSKSSSGNSSYVEPRNIIGWRKKLKSEETVPIRSGSGLRHRWLTARKLIRALTLDALNKLGFQLPDHQTETAHAQSDIVVSDAWDKYKHMQVEANALESKTIIGSLDLLATLDILAKTYPKGTAKKAKGYYLIKDNPHGSLPGCHKSVAPEEPVTDVVTTDPVRVSSLGTEAADEEVERLTGIPSNLDTSFEFEKYRKNPDVQYEYDDTLEPILRPLPEVSVADDSFCGNDPCRLGCVCSSLRRSAVRAKFAAPKHCGEAMCIFGCICKERRLHHGSKAIWDGSTVFDDDGRFYDSGGKLRSSRAPRPSKAALAALETEIYFESFNKRKKSSRSNTPNSLTSSHEPSQRGGIDRALIRSRSASNLGRQSPPLIEKQRDEQMEPINIEDYAVVKQEILIKDDPDLEEALNTSEALSERKMSEKQPDTAGHQHKARFRDKPNAPANNPDNDLDPRLIMMKNYKTAKSVVSLDKHGKERTQLVHSLVRKPVETPLPSTEEEEDMSDLDIGKLLNDNDDEIFTCARTTVYVPVRLRQHNTNTAPRYVGDSSSQDGQKSASPVSQPTQPIFPDPIIIDPIENIVSKAIPSKAVPSCKKANAIPPVSKQVAKVAKQTVEQSAPRVAKTDDDDVIVLSPSEASVVVKKEKQRLASEEAKMKEKYTVQMVLLQRKTILPGEDNSPHLLEIHSNCQWDKVRPHLFSKISSLADMGVYPAPSVLIIGSYQATILPRAGKATKIPGHLRNILKKNYMFSIRIKINCASAGDAAETNMSTQIAQAKVRKHKASTESIEGDTDVQIIKEERPLAKKTKKKTSPNKARATKMPSLVTSTASAAFARRNSISPITVSAQDPDIGMSAFGGLKVSAPGLTRLNDGGLGIQTTPESTNQLKTLLLSPTGHVISSGVTSLVGSGAKALTTGNTSNLSLYGNPKVVTSSSGAKTMLLSSTAQGMRPNSSAQPIRLSSSTHPIRPGLIPVKLVPSDISSKNGKPVFNIVQQLSTGVPLIPGAKPGVKTNIIRLAVPTSLSPSAVSPKLATQIRPGSVTFRPAGTTGSLQLGNLPSVVTVASALTTGPGVSSSNTVTLSNTDAKLGKIRIALPLKGVVQAGQQNRPTFLLPQPRGQSPQLRTPFPIRTGIPLGARLANVRLPNGKSLLVVTKSPGIGQGAPITLSTASVAPSSIGPIVISSDTSPCSSDQDNKATTEAAASPPIAGNAPSTQNNEPISSSPLVAQSPSTHSITATATTVLTTNSSAEHSSLGASSKTTLSISTPIVSPSPSGPLASILLPTLKSRPSLLSPNASTGELQKIPVIIKDKSGTCMAVNVQPFNQANATAKKEGAQRAPANAPMFLTLNSKGEIRHSSKNTAVKFQPVIAPKPLSAPVVLRPIVSSNFAAGANLKLKTSSIDIQPKPGISSSTINDTLLTSMSNNSSARSIASKYVKRLSNPTLPMKYENIGAIRRLAEALIVLPFKSNDTYPTELKHLPTILRRKDSKDDLSAYSLLQAELAMVLVYYFEHVYMFQKPRNMFESEPNYMFVETDPIVRAFSVIETCQKLDKSWPQSEEKLASLCKVVVRYCEAVSEELRVDAVCKFYTAPNDPKPEVQSWLSKAEKVVMESQELAIVLDSLGLTFECLQLMPCLYERMLKHIDSTRAAAAEGRSDPSTIVIDEGEGCDSKAYTDVAPNIRRKSTEKNEDSKSENSENGSSGSNFIDLEVDSIENDLPSDNQEEDANTMSSSEVDTEQCSKASKDSANSDEGDLLILVPESNEDQHRETHHLNQSNKEPVKRGAITNIDIATASKIRKVNSSDKSIASCDNEESEAIELIITKNKTKSEMENSEDDGSAIKDDNDQVIVRELKKTLSIPKLRKILPKLANAVTNERNKGARLVGPTYDVPPPLQKGEVKCKDDIPSSESISQENVHNVGPSSTINKSNPQIPLQQVDVKSNSEAPTVVQSTKTFENEPSKGPKSTTSISKAEVKPRNDQEETVPNILDKDRTNESESAQIKANLQPPLEKEEAKSKHDLHQSGSSTIKSDNERNKQPKSAITQSNVEPVVIESEMDEPHSDPIRTTLLHEQNGEPKLDAVISNISTPGQKEEHHQQDKEPTPIIVQLDTPPAERDSPTRQDKPETISFSIARTGNKVELLENHMQSMKKKEQHMDSNNVTLNRESTLQCEVKNSVSALEEPPERAPSKEERALSRVRVSDYQPHQQPPKQNPPHQVKVALPHFSSDASDLSAMLNPSVSVNANELKTLSRFTPTNISIKDVAAIDLPRKPVAILPKVENLPTAPPGIASVKSKQSACNLQSKQTMSNLKSKKTMSNLLSKQTVSDLKSKQTESNLQSKQTVSDLQSKQTVSDLASKQTVPNLQSKQTVSNLQSKQPESNRQLKITVTNRQPKQNKSDLQSEQTVPSLQSKETVSKLQPKQTVSSLQLNQTESNLQSKQTVSILKSNIRQNQKFIKIPLSDVIGQYTKMTSPAAAQGKAPDESLENPEKLGELLESPVAILEESETSVKNEQIDYEDEEAVEDITSFDPEPEPAKVKYPGFYIENNPLLYDNPGQSKMNRAKKRKLILNHPDPERVAEMLKATNAMKEEDIDIEENTKESSKETAAWRLKTEGGDTQGYGLRIKKKRKQGLETRLLEDEDSMLFQEELFCVESKEARHIHNDSLLKREGKANLKFMSESCERKSLALHCVRERHRRLELANSFAELANLSCPEGVLQYTTDGKLKTPKSDVIQHAILRIHGLHKEYNMLRAEQQEQQVMRHTLVRKLRAIKSRLRNQFAGVTRDETTGATIVCEEPELA